MGFLPITTLLGSTGVGGFYGFLEVITITNRGQPLKIQVNHQPELVLMNYMNYMASCMSFGVSFVCIRE